MSSARSLTKEQILDWRELLNARYSDLVKTTSNNPAFVSALEDVNALCDMALDSLARSERTFSDREAILKREERERADKKQDGATTVWGPELQNRPGGPIYRLGTSTGVTLPPQPERVTNTRNIAESDPVFARALLREAFAWGLDLRHKAGCTWAVPASNFQKGTACNCGRDDLKKRLNDFAFHHVEVADARSSTSNRGDVIEECAKVCEAQAESDAARARLQAPSILQRCAASIRALKEKP